MSSRFATPLPQGRGSMRALLGVLLATGLALPLGAQDSSAVSAPSGPCYRARPKPACSAFIVTNFGAYIVLSRRFGDDTPLRAVADWGVMFNVGARNAIGGSFFASLDEAGFGAGPAVRYRRWLSATASVEMAVGTPVVTSSEIKPGSVFGLVRWSPDHWFAVTVRPEVLRKQFVCGPVTCTEETRGRLSLGAEVGWVPGLVLTVGSAATILIVIVTALGGD